MLYVILRILAIIGIIILCILGLFIVLLFTVLICPIRYRISGDKLDKEIHLKIKLSYLFHIITARFYYPKPGTLEIRVFGILLKSKERKSIENKIINKTKDVSDENIDTDKMEETHEIDHEEEKAEPIYVENIPLQTNPVKKTVKDRFFAHPILWIRNRLKKIYYTIKGLYDKIKHIIHNITYYKDILTDPANQAFFNRLKHRCFVILKKIIPKHFQADIVVGTGSPDTTGYLCGLYGILLPVFGKRVNFTADFEQTVLNGNFCAKGYITIMTILIQAGKIYFDKQLRILLKQLKKEE